MNSERSGVGYGVAAYGLWGVFPLFFHALRRSGAVEIVLHRVLWSLLACLLILAAVRGWGQLGAVLRGRRQLGLLTAAAAFVAVNWGVYVFAVNSGHVVEGSLGYFVNPLVTVALGVVVLGERLRTAQWAAVGVGALAVAVLTVDYGRPPWISLVLAFTFAMYGLLKKRVGADVGALPGLTVETLVLAPVMAGILVWLEVTGRGSFGLDAPRQALLLASAGPVTVVPLLLFAAAARRSTLTTMGLLQYLTPVLQLLIGVLVLGEHVPPARWAGFALVWLALALLTTDTLRAGRATRRPASSLPAAAEPAA